DDHPGIAAAHLDGAVPVLHEYRLLTPSRARASAERASCEHSNTTTLGIDAGRGTAICPVLRTHVAGEGSCHRPCTTRSSSPVVEESQKMFRRSYLLIALVPLALAAACSDKPNGGIILTGVNTNTVLVRFINATAIPISVNNGGVVVAGSSNLVFGATSSCVP